MNDSGGSNVLIVDDNMHNLQFLGNILEENGYQPLVATNGPQADAQALSDLLVSVTAQFFQCHLARLLVGEDGQPMVQLDDQLIGQLWARLTTGELVQPTRWTILSICYARPMQKLISRPSL